MRGLRLVPLLLLAACSGGTPCPNPLEQCGNVCFDLRSDRLHCGTCGNACAAGLACLNGTCAVPSTEQECAQRKGGAFVTLSACGQVVKLWTTDAFFTTRAEALVLDPAAPGAAVPRFDLRPAADCDGQWSWHVDAITPAFVAGPDARCLACPAHIEEALSFWLADVGFWCPDPARFLAVDRR